VQGRQRARNEALAVSVGSEEEQVHARHGSSALAAGRRPAPTRSRLRGEVAGDVEQADLVADQQGQLEVVRTVIPGCICSGNSTVTRPRAGTVTCSPGPTITPSA
jgi:hypothetical protein